MINALFREAAVQADLVLEDGANLDDYGLRARIIHTPGHTPGSCSLWVDGHDAFVGDLLSTNGGAHAQRFYASNWSQIAGSLDRLSALEPKTIYPGHGRQLMDNDELKRLISSRQPVAK
jgi:glyoxylase-like metal-dependent hydrolase (beta-lactamase superfamily II)